MSAELVCWAPRLLSVVMIVVVSTTNASRMGAQDRPVTVTSGKAHAEVGRILEMDRILGKQRDLVCQHASAATAVRAYLIGLDVVDFQACPQEFVAAFRAHRNAWEQSIPFLEDHDSLRGEMHDLFDQIRQLGDEQRTRLDKHVREITETWAVVEKASANSQKSVPTEQTDSTLLTEVEIRQIFDRYARFDDSLVEMVADEFLFQDVTMNLKARKRDEILAMFASYRKSITDYRIEVHSILFIAPSVVDVQGRITGKLQGKPFETLFSTALVFDANKRIKSWTDHVNPGTFDH